jgi:hypothetical protein
MIVGSLTTLLLLQAVGVGLADADIMAVLHCDNHGMVNHGNRVHTLLMQKQVQADLIRLIKYLGVTNPGEALWEWAKGHVVESLGWAGSSLPEWLNSQVDKLAKEVLVAVT